MTKDEKHRELQLYLYNLRESMEKEGTWKEQYDLIWTIASDSLLFSNKQTIDKYFQQMVDSK